MLDTKITKIPNEKSKETEFENKPSYFENINLTEEQKTRIIKEIDDEFNVIIKQRQNEELEEKWERLDNAYDMQHDDELDSQFSLYDPLLREKIESISGDIIEAFFGMDTVFSFSPHPESKNLLAAEIAEKQEMFIDSKLDSVIPLQEEMELVAKSTVLKGVGILKFYHDIIVEDRTRIEEYEGITEIQTDGNGNPLIDKSGNPIIRNLGVEDFLRNFSEEIDEANEEKDTERINQFKSYIEKLSNNKKITIMVDSKEILYNDPKPCFIDLENFFVRTDVEGYEGLTKTKLIAERKKYSYWELKQKENDGDFFDIDSIIPYEENGNGNGYENQEYIVWECILYTKLKENDEYKRIIVWIEAESKKIIGAIRYPWYGIRSPYIPFYIKKTNKGFYQEGIGKDIYNLNIAQNALLNFSLEGTWIANTITPIIKRNSTLAQQFYNNQIAHGIPLFTDGNETIRFLNEYIKPLDIMSLLSLRQQISRQADDISGRSSLMTGRESIADPTAPASKTLALMNQSNRNIKRYIRSFIKSFNIIGDILLQMYYQICDEGMEFANRGRNKNNKNLIMTISREEMIARSNIKSMAFAFDFDELNKKKEFIAFYSMFRQEPVIANNPMAVYFMLRMIAKSWSPDIKQDIDKLLPNPEQMGNMIKQTIIQGTGQYLEAKQKEAQITGTPLNLNAQEVITQVTQMLSQLATPREEK